VKQLLLLIGKRSLNEAINEALKLATAKAAARPLLKPQDVRARAI
jgi:hypothetical protein